MAPTTNQPEPTRRPRTALLAVAAVCAAGFTAQTVLVLAHRGAPFPLDIAVHHWAVVHRTGGLTTAAVAISATGTGLPVYILAILAGCLAGGSRRWWGGAVAAVAALALGEALRYGISVAVARPRPFRGDWAHSAGGFAFPSGHTTTSALVAALLLVALARRRPGPWVVLGRLIAVSWAICVGLTRVYLGVHWPTDVLGGWLLAATLATVAAGVGPVLVSAVGRSRTRPLGDTRH